MNENTKYYYDKVMKFRRATGLDRGQDRETHDNLFAEELRELGAAKSAADIADALADITFIACGFASEYEDKMQCLDGLIMLLEGGYTKEGHIDLKTAFDIVYESNMSKLCTNDEIEPTADKYEALGVKTDFKQVEDKLFACYCAETVIGTDFVKGKLLKSVSYAEPNWSRADWLVL